MTYSKYYVDKSKLPDYTMYPRRADGFHTEIGYKLFIADTLAKLEEISEYSKKCKTNFGESPFMYTPPEGYAGFKK